MPASRHLRLRVLEALDQRVKQFRTREDLYPLRAPREPLVLEEVILHALNDDQVGFDHAALRSRTLLTLDWDDARWEAWVITLPSRVKLYCDSDAHETRILASGGPNAGTESDRLFLGLLSESAGEEFGIEMAGGAPTRVASSLDDREFLVDFFVNLFEVTHAEDSIRIVLPEAESALDGGIDFRHDVARWLRTVMR
ncbi:MAG: hypothetical protein M3Q85_15680 [Acidobacteriota bacterium]|nr:hypothetical protein [Acidobacteriota bacterium]